MGSWPTRRPANIVSACHLSASWRDRSAFWRVGVTQRSRRFRPDEPGKIVEEWSEYDELGILRQLGAVVATA
jgi:predicted ester cyclase